MYRKKKNIIDLKEGENIRDIFVVKFRKPIEKSRKTSTYWFSLRIGDKSGEIMLKYWDNDKENIEGIWSSIHEDDVIFVEGNVNVYRENLEIKAEKIKVLKKEEYLLEDFIPISKKSREELVKELENKIKMIKDNELRKFLENVLLKGDIAEKFQKAPAAMYNHHAYIHGLMEHSLNVCEIALQMKEKYGLDQDLLIAGALLHDIGKIYEFQVGTSIKHTKIGELLGHITIGVEIVSKEMEKYNIDENTKLKIIHIILSHHGELEYGAVKEPMFPEAFIIWLSDMMDAEVDHMVRRKKEAKTESDFMYVKHFSRNIFLR